MALLEIRDLKKHYPVRDGVFRRASQYVKAVDGVTLGNRAGRDAGARRRIGLRQDNARPLRGASGRAHLRVDRVRGPRTCRRCQRRRCARCAARCRSFSRTPTRRSTRACGSARSSAKGLRIHNIARGDERRSRVKELLARVGLRAEYYGRYPHEFSGGQRQRIGVARALAVNAKVHRRR